MARVSTLEIKRQDEATVPKIEERYTPEIVLGFVGPVASGVTTASEVFEKLLRDQFHYDVRRYRMSRIIASCAPLVGENHDQQLAGSKRVENLQKIGTKLRDIFGPGYVAKKCIENIGRARLDGGWKNPDRLEVALPLRRAHIVDSIKNPAELDIFRKIYGPQFILVGVFAPESIREGRLKHQGMSSTDITNIIEKDYNEGLPHGQDVRRTFHNADLYIRNDENHRGRIETTAIRYLDVVFSISVFTPTQHESAMLEAFSASSRSACLSRQVGAAIISENGEMLSVEWNDVPKAKGGLYSDDDKMNDRRCFKWMDKKCHNDSEKEKMYEEIYDELKRQNLFKKEMDCDRFKSVMSFSRIDSLIEFSRSVHAEMSAIVSVARSSRVGLQGAKIYTTTFPCHNCARHIVASGISEVYYIEPYAKSLAWDLHHDAISIDQEKGGETIPFRQYEGVSPRNMLRIFRQDTERKNSSKAIELDRRTAVPVFRAPLDGFTTFEAIVINELKETEDKPAR